jgi:hypothetical protein
MCWITSAGMMRNVAWYAVLVCEDGSAAISTIRYLFLRQVTQAKIEKYRYEQVFYMIIWFSVVSGGH